MLNYLSKLQDINFVTKMADRVGVEPTLPKHGLTVRCITIMLPINNSFVTYNEDIIQLSTLMSNIIFDKR